MARAARLVALADLAAVVEWGVRVEVVQCAEQAEARRVALARAGAIRPATGNS